MKLKYNKLSLAALSGLTLALTGSSLSAASGNWNVNNSGNWSTALNWSSNPTVPGTAAGDTIGFTNDISVAARTITIDGNINRFAGILNIGDSNNTHGFTIDRTGTGILTLDNGGSDAQINETGSVNDTISAPITLASNLAASVGGSLTLSGAIGESGGAKNITKTGAGTLTLTSLANSFTGNILVSGGKITTGTGPGDGINGYLGAVNGSRTITIGTGASIDLLANNVFGGGGKTAATIPAIVINGGTLNSTRFNIVGNLTLNGATLAQSSTDTLTYQGYQLLGSVTVGGTTASTISTGNAKGNHLLGGAGTTFTVADATSSAAVDLTVSAPLINASGDYANAAGVLVKAGAGTMALSGNNTYTGATTVSEGTLSITGGYLSTSTTINIASGAFLTTSVNNTFSGGGSGQGAAWTIAGTITGTSNGQTMPASVTLNNGTMSGTFKGDFGTFLSVGTTITANDATNTVNAGNIGMAAALTVNTPLAGDALTISSQLGGTSASGGALTKNGLGTLTLSGSNTYTGTTTVNAGTLLIGSNAPSGSVGALGNATTAVSLGGASSASLLTNGAFTVARIINVASGAGTTIIGGNTAASSSFTGNITLSKAVTLQAFTGGTVNFTTGTWTTGDFAVNVGTSGNTGTIQLNNSLSTNGGISVNFGTLQLGSSDRLGNTTPVNVAGGTLALGTNTDTVGAVTLTSGSITGTGTGRLTGTVSAFDVRSGTISAKLGGTVGLTKTTGGTVTISSDNSSGGYTGATLVSAGTLVIDGNISTSITTVNGTGTLGGSGTVGAVIIQAGGTLAPGNSPGNITGATLSLADNANFNIEIDKSLSPINDSITLIGNFSNALAITTGANLNLALNGTFVLGDRFTLASYNTANGTWNGGLFNLGAGTSTLADDSMFQHGGYDWRINYDDLTDTFTNSTESYVDGGKYLTLTVIPEPNVAALLGSLALLTLLRRRRN